MVSITIISSATVLYLYKNLKHVNEMVDDRRHLIARTVYPGRSGHMKFKTESYSSGKLKQSRTKCIRITYRDYVKDIKSILHCSHEIPNLSLNDVTKARKSKTEWQCQENVQQKTQFRESHRMDYFALEVLSHC